jgi:hypothetical protein
MVWFITNTSFKFVPPALEYVNQFKESDNGKGLEILKRCMLGMGCL